MIAHANVAVQANYVPPVSIHPLSAYPSNQTSAAGHELEIDRHAWTKHG